MRLYEVLQNSPTIKILRIVEPSLLKRWTYRECIHGFTLGLCESRNYPGKILEELIERLAITDLQYRCFRKTLCFRMLKEVISVFCAFIEKNSIDLEKIRTGFWRSKRLQVFGH